ncbi:TPA: hypothetical protein RJ180_001122 [Mannheimia haemolytica]|nr:hypothetical protein [Mannheimia haemolytica]
MHRKAPVFNTSVSLIPEKFRQIPIILLFLSFNGSIHQQIIMGLIIILAVAFDTYAKSRRGAL